MPEFQCEKSLDLLGSKGELRATVVWYKKPGSTTLAFSALKNRHLCLSRILYTLLYTSIEQKQKRTPCALLFVASSSNANNTLLHRKKKLCFYFCPLLSQSSRGYSVPHPSQNTAKRSDGAHQIICLHELELNSIWRLDRYFEASVEQNGSNSTQRQKTSFGL